MALRSWQDKARNREESGNLGSAANASGQTAHAECNASFPGAKLQLSEVQFPHLHPENYHTPSHTWEVPSISLVIAQC